MCALGKHVGVVALCRVDTVPRPDQKKGAGITKQNLSWALADQKPDQQDELPNEALLDLLLVWECRAWQ